jgi:hypothetical protein
MIHPRGWTCERTVLQLEGYLLSTLVLGDSIAVAEHVEACGECAQRLALYRLTTVTVPSRRERRG